MASDNSWASAISMFVGAGGLALGLALLAFGFYVAREGATTQVAAIMLAVALVIPVGAFAAVFLGMIGAFDEVVQHGPNVTPADLSGGVASSLGYGGLALLGFVLGLAGALRVFMAARNAAESPDDLHPQIA